MRAHLHAGAFLAVLLVTVAGATAGGANTGTGSGTGSGAENDVDRGVGALLRGHEMSTLDGEPARLSDFADEVLVVNFWASWCAPCREELPLLDEWDAGWRERGARVVAISIDERRRNARHLVEDEELSLTAWHDPPDGLAAALDLAAVPSTYLLDREGRVVMVIHGSSRSDLDRLHRAVEALLGAGNGRRSM